MHEYLDLPGTAQLAAAIGGATAVGILLVRILEQLVTSRRQTEERKIAMDNRQELQTIREELQRLTTNQVSQHSEHIAHQQRAQITSTEILAILRERGG